MSKEALKTISRAMDALELKYGFMEYIVPGGEEPPKTYFTGEYQETEPISEDGLQETQFILNGFSREPWISLENAKEKISKYFSKVSGRTSLLKMDQRGCFLWQQSGYPNGGCRTEKNSDQPNN